MGNVKSFSVDPAKALWRERIVDFVRQHYTPNQIRNFRVLCLAGREMNEVFDVYDELNVKRKNVVSLECDPVEFAALSTLNDSLEQRIKVVPATALEYLSHPATQPFDLISLDYCGYFDDDKALTLGAIARGGKLTPRAVLITNYQMGRENRTIQGGLRATGVFIGAHDHLIRADFAEHRAFFMQHRDTIDDETELAKLRDITVQCTPVAEMAHGTGFWNTPFFRLWLQTQPEDNRRRIEYSIERMNRSEEPEQRELLSKFLVDGLDRETALLVTYFAKSQMTSYDCKEREAYKYVSDSGTPMISDFYLFEQERFAFSDRTRKSVSYELKGNKLLFWYHSVKSKGLFEGLREHQRQMVQRAQMQDNRFVLERVLLNGDENNTNSSERDSASPQRREKAQREIIYAALASGIPDDEMMSTYGLTKMQLAGYKATHTRTNNGETSGVRKKAIATPFAPADLEVITDLLIDGYKATAIATLFTKEDGTVRYSWQSIAAYKAAQTKAGGAVSNELRFRQMKPEVMERDGHTCQWCNKSAGEQRGRSGHNFHVHHINYNHDDTRPDNLVTLCTSCHARTNTIQSGGEMREYFELLMVERYSATSTSA